uniref:Uncharacterized protein n=1 Tax=Cacopsylla melanoneura TaxID=428564 RepID=A0A8D8U1S7_9HEMI
MFHFHVYLYHICIRIRNPVLNVRIRVYTMYMYTTALSYLNIICKYNSVIYLSIYCTVYNCTLYNTSFMFPHILYPWICCGQAQVSFLGSREGCVIPLISSEQRLNG